MKAVLRSIKPYWLYCIIIGVKTVEVGKDFPKSNDWNKAVFLYCSQDKKSFNCIPEKDREWMRKYFGKVACRFVCDNIIDYTLDPYGYHSYFINDDDFENTGFIFCEELWEYGKGKTLYGWHISDLVIYDKPRELGEFRSYNVGIRLENGYPLPTHEIQRPPQSWMYIESEDKK